MAGLYESLASASDTDHEWRPPDYGTRLAGPIGVIDQCGAGQIALSDPGISEHAAGIERAHQPV